MSCHPLGVFPFEPLRRALERRLPEISTTNPDGGVQVLHAGDLGRSSEVLGFSRRVLSRWSAGQFLTLRAADECATRLGMHPTAIWDDFNAVCDQLDQRAADNQRRYRARRLERRRSTAATAGSR